MKTTATNKKIRELLTAITDGALVLQPEFQRRLVWTPRHKQLFIKTVLEGLPFPEIFLCDGEVDVDTGKGSQQVVDGQQRITTLYQYFKGSQDLRLGSLTPYADLDQEVKQKFLNYDVVVRDLGSLTDSEIRDVFHRMNSTQYGLNAMEVNNARFDGALKQAADRVSKWEIFERRKVFTAVDDRRMGDVRWCLTVIITVISGYFSRDVEHEVYLEKYNDEFPMESEVLARLETTLAFLDGLGLATNSRAWQKNDLFTSVVEVYRLNPENCIDRDGVAAKMDEFYAAVDLVSENKTPPAEYAVDAVQYHTDVISGTNERARRARRGDVIKRLISSYFAAA
ncbi:DUF262 domain-containing protein [Streptomyces sp. NPDC052682]|uniref:DUF262 domain-containing protein n=1 Tax=Streptomyces sp. NPDC052682 TaxID=3154954 RepID=UPI003444718B